jgi:hypothetical protein
MGALAWWPNLANRRSSMGGGKTHACLPRVGDDRHFPEWVAWSRRRSDHRGRPHHWCGDRAGGLPGARYATSRNMRGRRSTSERYLQVASPGSGRGATNLDEPRTIAEWIEADAASPGLRSVTVSSIDEHGGWLVAEEAPAPRPAADGRDRGCGGAELARTPVQIARSCDRCRRRIRPGRPHQDRASAFRRTGPCQGLQQLAGCVRHRTLGRRSNRDRSRSCVMMYGILREDGLTDGGGLAPRGSLHARHASPVPPPLAQVELP